jgi:hypothetical protein
VFCEGLVNDIRKEELWWEYSVELADPQADEVGANEMRVLELGIVLELSLLAAVQDALLSCDNPTRRRRRRRRLAGTYGISAMDYHPQDVLQDQGEFSLMVIHQFQTNLD